MVSAADDGLPAPPHPRLQPADRRPARLPALPLPPQSHPPQHPQRLPRRADQPLGGGQQPRGAGQDVGGRVQLHRLPAGRGRLPDTALRPLRPLLRHGCAQAALRHALLSGTV